MYLVKNIFSVLIVIFLWLFVSCSKDMESENTSSISEYYQFYPTPFAYWTEYKIDTITYTKSSNDTAVTISSSSVYQREEIGDTITAFGKPYPLLIQSYRRKKLSDNWTFYRNQSLYTSSNAITRNIDNIKTINLQFPISPTQQWKGNKYIDSSIFPTQYDWTFYYTGLYNRIQLSTMTFDSTITVIQFADSNAIEKTLFYEVYAKNVGLILAEYQKLEKQNGANPWSMPENGMIVRKTIVNWKK